MGTVVKESSGITINFAHNVVIKVPLEEGRVVGIGSVSVGDLPLRNPDVAMVPFIRSVNGVDYSSFRLEEIVEGPDSCEIKTVAFGIPRLEGYYGDQYNGRLLNLCKDDPVREDHLTWLFQSETLTLDGTDYHGFSYALRFSSNTEKIHRIVVKSTWEIGGCAIGNTVLSQGQVTPPVYTVEEDTHFTSACLQSLTRFGDPTGMSFQLCPRYGLHQAFDFIASEQGSLAGYWPEKADVRSFIQKNPGEDVLFVIDAMNWQATHNVETARKCMVFAPSEGGMPEHTMRNRWKDVYDYVGNLTRSFFNIKASRPAPESTVPNSLKLQTDGTFKSVVDNQVIDSTDYFRFLADHYVPRLAKHGIKRFWPDSSVETDPTERGTLRKLDQGVHGDLNVGSVCTVHRYRPSDLFGGMKGWRYLYDKCHEFGMELGHWLGPHLSYHAPILEEHPDWMLADPTTLTAAGGYPNFCLAVLNWNTPVREWILDDIKRWKQEGGLDYVWFDSFGNLGLFPVDYSREMQCNTFAIAEFIALLQAAGIRDVTIEGMSVLGISGAHIMDESPKTFNGVQWIAGQNSWLWYEENEDMLCGQAPRLWVNKERDEENVRKRHFRCLANRCVGELLRYAGIHDDVRDWYRGYLDTYFAVEGDLVKRELLPDKQGVLWHNGTRKTLFAFKDFEFGHPVKDLQVLEHGRREEISQQSADIDAAAWHVYQFQSL